MEFFCKKAKILISINKHKIKAFKKKIKSEIEKI